MDTRAWFKELLDEGAKSLVKKVMTGTEGRRSFTDKELELVRKGIEKRIIIVEGNKFTLPPKQQYDAFTLNRELFLQFATFVELIEQYGYKVEDCRFEYHLMDICVLKDAKPYIYVETMVEDSRTRKLVDDIEKKYSKNVQSLMNLPDRGNDALCKSKCIFSDKPKFLKIVTPNTACSYSVEHTSEGFNLSTIEDIPEAE